MDKKRIFPLFLTVLLVLSGCGGGEESSSQSSASSGDGASTAALSDMFTDRDFEIGYDESESALIQLTGDSAQCDSSAVEISGGTITITDEGTYLLTGTLGDGMVIVDAEATDKVQLVLNGASITNSTSAALYVRQADKVFVTTASGTENTLSSTGEYVAIDENNIDAALFSKEDLTLNGAGALTIQAAVGHGVVSKDDLVITCGDYAITAASHALSGKDSIRIANGTFTLNSGKDGLHAENTDDASLGFLYIADGTFDITAQGDGLSAGTTLQIEGGQYTLLSAGGSSNAASQGTSGMFGSSSSTEDSVSTKGIKASGDLSISGGTFSMDCADDGIHSNANVSISGGTFQIATGDDGIHGDTNVAILGGAIHISESYEGIEGLRIDITGGEIQLVASDDGLNAAGGNDESGFDSFGGGFRGPDSFASGSDSDASVNIAGGTLVVDAAGDGIDSNGSLTVSGGETYISGPTNGGNGALDYATDATVTGGIFVAAGSSQMAMNFGSSSTQGVMLVSVNTQQAGSAVTLADSGGQALLSWTAGKTFDSILISRPGLAQGGTYTLTAGSYETTVTMNSLVYSTSGDIGMGGMGGQPGGMGGQPGGRR